MVLVPSVIFNTDLMKFSARIGEKKYKWGKLVHSVLSQLVETMAKYSKISYPNQIRNPQVRKKSDEKQEELLQTFSCCCIMLNQHNKAANQRPVISFALDKTCIFSHQRQFSPALTWKNVV